ncbi:MAG TPA: 30S ribosomal protein S6 [Candidatus Acidoferrales bacterium]|nr:30S ribosomal protein S6 [Candidatus Acidoferrales bacterium]
MNGSDQPFRYETLFVLHPEQAGRAKEFIERFKRIVEGLNGTVTHVEEWGIRDLAYRIQKQTKGYYSLMQFNAPPKAAAELDRNLKLSEGVIRHIIVRADEDIAGARAGAEKGAPKKSAEGEPAKPQP